MVKLVNLECNPKTEWEFNYLHSVLKQRDSLLPSQNNPKKVSEFLSLESVIRIAMKPPFSPHPKQQSPSTFMLSQPDTTELMFGATNTS